MHGRKKSVQITHGRQRRRERHEDHGGLLDAVKAEQASRLERAFKAPVIRPLTDAQRALDGAIFSSPLTFAIGPAGTGKTWLVAARMAEAFRDGRIDRIIVSRPAVEAGEEMGFLPGELGEKFDPYFRPVRDVFVEVLGRGRLDYAIKAEQIEARPLAYLRGATFKRAGVILDEAQNTTPSQMKMFLTRIGEGACVVVNGDPDQKDIAGPSGLVDAVRRLERIAAVSVVRFARSDIVRSGLCQDIVEAYETPVGSGLSLVA